MQAARSRYPILQAVALLVLLLLASAGLLLVIVDNPSFDIQVAIPNYAPILILVEFFIYLLAFLLFFSSLDLLTAFSVSLMISALRAVATLGAAAAVYEIFPYAATPAGEELSYEMWQYWASLYLGDPRFVGVQVLLIAAAFIPYLGNNFPGLLGLAPEPAPTTGSAGVEASSTSESINLPVGGFVQCYSYEELRNTVRKIPNVIGYALATSEGLLVFGDGRKLALPLESTVPRFQVGSMIIHQFQEKSGLHGSELWQFGEDHALVMMTIRPCFFLLLFFRPDIDLREIEPRIRSVQRSAETFLSDRHRGLVLAEQEDEPVA